MAQQETLDPLPSLESSSDLSESESQSQSQSSLSSSDPSLSRNVSFSRLNAQAPAFKPTRPPIQQQSQQLPRIIIPSPPPPGMLHVYHPPTPFHVPIRSSVGIPPTQMVPVQNHHVHHHRPHHHGNHQYVPVRNHNEYYGGGGDEVVGKKAGFQGVDHDRKKDRADGASGAVNEIKDGLSDEVAQKILNQVEYYFSDLNLATTDHLMRFISKDSEGYVPISVVAAFKKIKSLISGNSQLAAVLRTSSKLVVSEDGKKVRRQHPITISDMEELQSRIVLAENLPEDHCHQNLMKIFSTVGSVKTIRTCQPQMSGSGVSSASKSTKADGMHLANKLHAFAEYETIELAEKAVIELNEEGNWRKGLRVRLMLKRTSKDLKPAPARGRKGNDAEGSYEEDDASTSEPNLNEKSFEDCSQQWDGLHSNEHTQGEEIVHEKEGGQRKGRNRGRGKGRGRAQYHHHNNRGNHHNHVGNAGPSNNSGNYDQPIIGKQPPGPRMPDGTRGFAMGRGKQVAC